MRKKGVFPLDILVIKTELRFITLKLLTFMKNFKTIFFLIVLSLFIYDCNDSKKNKENYGLPVHRIDSLSVVINPSKFDNWKSLLEKIDNIVCNDSIPKLIIKSNSRIKNIYLGNPCWLNYACLLIKQKNVIEIYNDSVIKMNEFFPIDSLENILYRDFHNNGRNENLLQSPEKLLFQISYDQQSFENLERQLNDLVEKFEKISKNRNINIWFNERLTEIEIPPPPSENKTF